MTKGKRWIAAGAATALLCAVVALIFFFGKSAAVNTVSQGGLFWEERAQDYALSAPLPSSGQGDIAIPGYSTVYFPAGETLVPMTLYNPAQNACLFQFALYLEGEEEPIASTGLIQPGKAVQEITLARPLAPGDYTLNIQVNTYTSDMQTALNNAFVKAELRVFA